MSYPFYHHYQTPIILTSAAVGLALAGTIFCAIMRWIRIPKRAQDIDLGATSNYRFITTDLVARGPSDIELCDIPQPRPRAYIAGVTCYEEYHQQWFCENAPTSSRGAGMSPPAIVVRVSLEPTQVPVLGAIQGDDREPQQALLRSPGSISKSTKESDIVQECQEPLLMSPKDTDLCKI